jgi:hypothetical protein
VNVDIPSGTTDDVATPEPLENPTRTPAARVPLALCRTVRRRPVAGVFAVPAAR